jgi:predicted DNA-binding transcriptional regulator AlpA
MPTPTSRMLRLPQVIELTGLGRDLIYHLRHTGGFPKTRKIPRKMRAVRVSPESARQVAQRQGDPRARGASRRLSTIASMRQRPAHFVPAPARRNLGRPSRGNSHLRRKRRTALHLRHRSRDDRDAGHSESSDEELANTADPAIAGP